MEMRYAPIVLFVFNRADHVRRAVEALRANPCAAESELYIYSDGARDDRDREGVARVRSYCREIHGFARVHLIEREENWGIEKSEIAALTELFARYAACIVLEDDLTVGTQFLSYMNLALERYRREKRVISIAGYSHIDEPRRRAGDPEFYFSQLITSWGWATWADRWALFDGGEPDMACLASDEERRRFDLDGVCPYTQMLTQQLREHYVTWDVAWYYTAFSRGMLTLTPVGTLVNNIGMDGSGVHYNNEEIDSNRERCVEHGYEFRFPDRIELDTVMREREKEGIAKRQRWERRKYRSFKLRTLVKRFLPHRGKEQGKNGRGKEAL